MNQAEVQDILERVERLAPEDQVAVAEQLDRLTLMRRAVELQDRIASRAESLGITDEDIDEALREVRREKPLHKRSSTPTP